jgi:hypothetical protein
VEVNYYINFIEFDFKVLNSEYYIIEVCKKKDYINFFMNLENVDDVLVYLKKCETG